MEFKELVEALLRENKKSKRWLAEQMGVTPSAISMMLGRGNATVESLCGICDALEYEITIQPKRRRGARPEGQLVLEKKP